MKKYSVFFILFLIAPLTLYLLLSAIPTLSEKHKSDFQKDYKIYSLVLPEQMSFAGEDVPLEIEDVWERLDREMLSNVYWQSNTLLNIKRANRWFPLIEEVLKKNGIPDDFKYIAMIESSFMNVVSPSDAHGFWQFIPETAKSYGLEVNEKVDERYHVAKATEAACNYFKDAYKTFGSWTLTAASYNMGINGLNYQLKTQQVDNFYDLLLNVETSRYIFRILAVKEIYEHPTHYGFVILDDHLYTPYSTYTVTVDTTIDNLVDFALKNNTNYRMLKILNPWLRKSDLPNKAQKIYEILLPLDVKRNKGKSDINEEAQKNIPQQDSTFIHIVQKHQSLQDIAKIYQVEVQQIKEWNGLKNEYLEKGQELKIIISKPSNP